MNDLIKKLSLVLVFVLCVTIAGCTSYGRGTNQVEIKEAGESKTLDLLQQVNELETQNLTLKDQVEVLTYELEQVNRRVQTQQTELDRLYQKDGFSGYNYSQAAGSEPQPSLESTTTQDGYQPPEQEINVASPSAPDDGQYPTSGGTVQSISQTTTSLSAQAIYDNGFDQLKQGQYSKSIQAFAQLLATYPGSDLADDAQYWTGEAYYVNRQFDKALESFRHVVNSYPEGDRAADALLKIGYIYTEQGDAKNARKVFNDIIVSYPDDRVSDFARDRLKNLGT